jgi:hypothetical protein
VNGVKYHTKEYAKTCITHNSSIFVLGNDCNSVMEYYGEFKNILKLCYSDQNLVYLFNCD